MFKHLFFFILSLSFCFSLAQKKIDQSTKEKVKQEFTQKFDGFINTIKSEYSGSIRREFIDFYDGLDEFILNQFDEENFIFDSPLNAKVDEIYKELYSSQTEIPKDLIFLVSKNTSFNAFCFPGGTIVINSGAIYYVDNENQLANIIAHEIGHYLLSHSQKQILKSISDKQNSSKKEKLKEINKSKYNKGEKAFDFLKDKIYSQSKLKREQELEADSIAYTILKKSNFKQNEALRTLDLLLEYDTIKPKGVQFKTFKEVFNLPKQPFLEKWFDKDDFSKYTYIPDDDRISSDSIRSHPDEEERKLHLKSIFSELESKSIPDKSSDSFSSLKEMVKSDQVDHLYFFEEYGLVAYISLLRIQNNYQTDKHKKMLGKAFEKIYESRKNYTANKYLDRIDPSSQSESYSAFLNFMWNLDLNELKTISDYYK